MQKKTYLQQCLRNAKTIRWADNFMPLKFYIAPFRFYSKINEEYKYKDMVIRALDTWQKASSGKISFAIVNTLLESQINLDWKRVDRQALGHCYFNFDAQTRLYSAEIQIGISDGILHQEYMHEDEVYHTILHEIGHALGLGHSDNEHDIMYTPHKYGVIKLSQRDIQTLKWLYKFPAGVHFSEIPPKYKMQASDLDTLVLKLMQNNPQSDFEKVKQGLISPQKDLLEEQTNIADLKKYHLSLQNIKLPDEVRKHFLNKSSDLK